MQVFLPILFRSYKFTRCQHITSVLFYIKPAHFYNFFTNVDLSVVDLGLGARGKVKKGSLRTLSYSSNRYKTF